MTSCGQKCNSSKRFIVLEEFYDEFVEKLYETMKDLKVGDPMDENVDIGPLAKKELVEELEKMVEKSVEK
jgi:succinate-semialdehyde dehydrogenase/glutarate-semialdehyde dehydrogenase